MAGLDLELPEIPDHAEAAPEPLVTLVGMRAEEQRFGREDALGTFLLLGVTASPPLLTRTGTAPPTTGPRLQGTPNTPAESDTDGEVQSSSHPWSPGTGLAAQAAEETRQLGGSVQCLQQCRPHPRSPHPASLWEGKRGKVTA